MRWTARGLGIVALLFHTLSFAGDLGSSQHQQGDTGKLLVWGIMMAAMIAAWKWERLGGAVIIVIFLVQAVMNSGIVSMWAMWAAPVIGILFLLSGVLARKSTGASIPV